MALHAIRGLSAHAQEQLRSRFGLYERHDFVAFYTLVSGERGKDWQPYRLPHDNQVNCTGRQVVFNGETIQAVVAQNPPDHPFVVTVWGIAVPDVPTSSPRELQAQATALEEKIKALESKAQAQTDIIESMQKNYEAQTRVVSEALKDVQEFHELKAAMVLVGAYLWPEEDPV